VRFIALLVAAWAVLASASAAHGHASLIRSEPVDRAVMAQPPPNLKLTFNEPVSPLVLRLVRPTGAIIDLKAMALSDGATLVVTLPLDLSVGTHLLSWRVISADGHPVGGSLTFSIGHPSAAPVPSLAAADDLRLRAAIWLARLALYVGLFFGVGGAFFAVWIAASVPSGWQQTATTRALECGVIAALLSVGFHGADVLGLALTDIRELRVWGGGLASAYGLTLCIAVIALAFGLAAVMTTGRMTRLYAALALAGVGTALAASGHAATAGPELVTRPAVFLHGVSVTFWVGALLPLSAALRANERLSELARFSKIIPWPLLVLIVSGFALAIVQLRQIDALWTTTYGVVLSCKLVAVCLLLGLAALNRSLTPRVLTREPLSTRMLRRSILAEAAIAVLILGLVASWRFTPPPRSLLAVAQPVHAHIHADRAMADLQIELSRDDGLRIRLSLLDGQFRPLTAKEVTLILSKPDLGIEPLRLVATHVEATIWQIDGVRLPVSGRWRVRVEALISDFEKVALEDEIDLSK
jgi:copper transport protein